MGWPPGAPLKPTEVYDSYWRFAAERQDVFFRRLHRLPPPWTDDPVLRAHKFTNAYRASDRVSQYLIRPMKSKVLGFLKANARLIGSR